jgi:hypothetical protein
LGPFTIQNRPGSRQQSHRTPTRHSPGSIQKPGPEPRPPDPPPGFPRSTNALRGAGGGRAGGAFADQGRPGGGSVGRGSGPGVCIDSGGALVRLQRDCGRDPAFFGPTVIMQTPAPKVCLALGFARPGLYDYLQGDTPGVPRGPKGCPRGGPPQGPPRAPRYHSNEK